MKQMHRMRMVALASAALLLLSLAGCDRTDNRVASPQIDPSGDAPIATEQVDPRIATEIEQAARRAAQASRAAASAAAAELKEASEKAAVVTARAAESAREAASRIGEKLEDALIIAKVTTGLAADKNLTALKIKVQSRDGVVTLTGPAPTEAARVRAEEIARNVKGVTSVNNQLSVQAPAG